MNKYLFLLDVFKFWLLAMSIMAAWAGHQLGLWLFFLSMGMHYLSEKLKDETKPHPQSREG